MSSAANEQWGVGSIARFVIESPGTACGAPLAGYGPRARSVEVLAQLPKAS